MCFPKRADFVNMGASTSTLVQRCLLSTTPCLNNAAIARSGFLYRADDRTTRAFLAVPKESSTTWVPTATLVC